MTNSLLPMGDWSVPGGSHWWNIWTPHCKVGSIHAPRAWSPCILVGCIHAHRASHRATQGSYTRNGAMLDHMVIDVPSEEEGNTVSLRDQEAWSKKDWDYLGMMMMLPFCKAWSSIWMVIHLIMGKTQRCSVAWSSSWCLPQWLAPLSSVLKSSLVRFFTSKRGNWQPKPV